MGFAKSKDTTINTIIGEDTTVEGTIILKGNIIVYGKVSGEVQTDGIIRIAPDAEIHGNLRGQHILLGGSVEGNLFATGKVELGQKASLRGDVHANQIVIEEGALFEGKCDMHLKTGAS